MESIYMTEVLPSDSAFGTPTRMTWTQWDVFQRVRVQKGEGRDWCRALLCDGGLYLWV